MYIHNLNKDKEEVAYWRKHHELNEIFLALAEDKGIKDYDLNCVPIPLTAKDLQGILDNYRDDPEIIDEDTHAKLSHCVFVAGTGANLEYYGWW